MSHFSVLTAVSLPDDLSDQIQQIPEQEILAHIMEVAFLTHLQGIPLSLDSDALSIQPQMRLESFVEELVCQRLDPYWEYTQDPKNLEFIDCTEQSRHEYEHSVLDCVRMPNGRILSIYDREFFHKYEVHEGIIYQMPFGQLHHRKRTKKTRHMKLLPDYPARKLFPTYESFAKDCYAYSFEPTRQAWGYYVNPNTKWDWCSVGDRFPEVFLVPENCQTFILGNRGYLPKNLFDNPAPAGYRWVAGARKCDIAWDVMQEWKIRQDTEQFHNLEAWYLDGKLPEGTLGLSITEQGIVQSGALVYIKNESLDDYLARNQCTEACHCPVSPYAYLSDYGWSEFCDVFACGKENADQVWDRMVQEFIAALPEESMLVYVDCHI